MVSYQAWVGIVNDVADRRGPSNRTGNYQADLLSAAGTVWSRNKTDIKQATRQQAETMAENLIDYSQ